MKIVILLLACFLLSGCMSDLSQLRGSVTGVEEVGGGSSGGGGGSVR